MILPPWPNTVDSGATQRENWHGWLEDAWGNPSVSEAIRTASPALADRIDAVLEGQAADDRQMRRLVMSITRYLLRLTGRPTPFGLFAGVAAVGIGGEPMARWGDDHRPVVRPDAVWMDEVITRLEAIPELLGRLPVVANNLCIVRGDRLVLPCQPSTRGPDDLDPAEVTVRNSLPVQSVLSAARAPVTVNRLVALLSGEFPQAPADAVAGMIGSLVKQRILITSLHASAAETDAFVHLVAQLDLARAQEVVDAAVPAVQLRDIALDLAEHNGCTDAGQRRLIRRRAMTKMSAFTSTVKQPLMTDLAVDCQIELPSAVAREAAAAAAALARLTPYPFGSSVWADYHMRFVERFGPGAVVPVAELVHADSGLGFPATYRGSRLKKPASGLSERDRRLIALGQEAAIDGSIEVLLDDKAIDRIAFDGIESAVPVPHAELAFQLLAPSLADLRAGRFQLTVTGALRAAGATTGRFLSILNPADRDRIMKSYAALPTLEENAVAAQVSCPPLYVRTGNVNRAPAVLAHVIPLAEHHQAGEGTIALDDLAVTSDGTTMRLVSVSTGRLIEPTVMNAVDFRNHTQPVVRFLCEVVRAHTATFAGFYWGAADELPFLPRLRYGRTVLSPARWTVTADQFPGRRSPWPQWDTAVEAWRRRFRVPSHVQLDENGQELPLDLDEPGHRALLRAHLDQHGAGVLAETARSADYGWIGGRAHEIVVPLASTAPAAVTKPEVSYRPLRRDDGHLPGDSPWLFAKLYGHPERQGEILTALLPDLLDDLHRPAWWFLRYADPDPHLRLRFRTGNDGFATAARHLGAWTAKLRTIGLISHLQLDTYLPESGRFGNGATMEAAENVFMADSLAAIAEITHSSTSGLDLHALSAASFIDLTTALLGDRTTADDWLIDKITTDRTEPLDRTLFADALSLTAPGVTRAGTPSPRCAPEVDAAWRERGSALTAYRDLLLQDGAPTPSGVLGTLLHLHHIRAAGLDPDGERTAHRLARAAALTWKSRTRDGTR
ncbi:lantibiotic dehydratase [Kitasatospora sp. NPDC028055]|uniref:lantibiotic dehydratase n=1 Tax=Kitasatospora sp. NPDC028055 TaxID=3155653 RepID=UPI00340F03FC